MNKVMVFILISMLLAGCSSTSRTPISHIYAFGDTFSDNGNAYKINKGILAETGENAEAMKWFETFYWQGRYTNGPVAVEVLADRLKIDLTDYAVTYANSDTSNAVDTDFAEFKNTGLLGQAQKYIASLKGEKADPDALYHIKIGSGAFMNLYEGDPKPIADQVIANISEAISLLAAAGAKQYMVANMHNISAYPDKSEMDVSGAKAYQSYFNSTLPVAMEKLARELGVKITIFDYQAVEDHIMSNPAEYGITNIMDQCLDATDFTESDTTVCKSPDEYFFWDGGRPTRTVHQILGEAMAEQLSK